MQKLPAFAAVAALSLIALLVWLFSRPGADSPQPGAPGADPAAAGTPAEPRLAEAARDSAETSPAAPDPTRVALGTDAAATGPALVGRVVDAEGRPVAGATVAASVGLRAAFDPARFADGGLEELQAQARAARDQRVEVETDAAGRFRVRPPGSAGTVELRVRARGYAVLRQDAERPEETDRDLGTLELRSGAVVAGRVVDAAGRPLADAAVVQRSGGRDSPLDALDLPLPIDLDLLPGAGERTGTDREGRFEFAHAVAGAFDLRVRHPEHPPARLEGLSVAAGATLTDLLVVVEPGASISGTLVGVPDGVRELRVMAAEPRAGAGAAAEGPLAVFLDQAGEMLSQSGLDAGLGERSAPVAEDGSFVLRGLRVGRTYRVWAVQTGRGLGAITACSPRLEVLSGAGAVQLRYEIGIEVHFAVVDAATGAPIESLSVRDRLTGGESSGRLMDMVGMATPAAAPRDYPDGQVTLADLRPRDRQKLDLTVAAPGYAQFERRGIELPTSGSLDLGVIRLEVAPRLRVEVVGADGAPVAGARVRVRTERDGDGRDGPGSGPGGFDLERLSEQIGDGGGRGGVRTDAAGRCEFDLAGDRPFVVSVRADGFAPYESETLRVGDRSGVDHAVRLLRGGRVEVTVLEADGSPAVGADVDHRGDAGARGRARTDATGLAVFEGLAAGEHRFRIGGGGPGADLLIEVAQIGGPGVPDGAGWETVRVTEGATASLRLSKSASASLSGIVSVDGLPLAGARVSFQKGSGADGAAGGTEAQVMAAFGGMGGGRGSSSRTDEAGRYRLADVAAGEHRLRITHGDRAMPAEVRVVLRSGENTFDIALDTSTLRGTVFDPDGRPVAGATLRIAPASSDANDPSAMIAGALEGAFGGGAGRGGSPQVRTDADGRFELRGVRGGEAVVVTASAKGFAPTRSQPVTTAVRGVTDGVEIRLTAAGSVRVRVANAPPFASVQASFEGEEGAPPVIRMLQRGSGTLDGLRPGRWRIALLAPGQDMSNPPTREVEVRAGAVVDVDF